MIKNDSIKKVKLCKIIVAISNESTRTFGYYLDKQKGLADSKGKGWFNSDGYCCRVVEAIQLSDGRCALVDDMFFIAEEKQAMAENEESIKEEALKKLTDEEKLILGLT